MSKKSTIRKPDVTSCFPQNFVVSVSGFRMPESFEISLKDGVLVYQKDIFGYGVKVPEPTTISPSPEAWQTFWDKVDQIGVWKWRKDYSDNDICDGIQWRVELRVGKRRMKSYGSNSFPLEDGSPCDKPTKAFETFQAAVSKLCVNGERQTEP